MEAADLLAATPLFGGAAAAEFAGLLPSTRTRRFNKGAHLWRVGDRADAMMVISSGEVQISRVGPNGDVFTVEVYLAADAVGQLPFFDLHPVRVMDARAGTTVECLEVPRAALVAHLEAHPALAMRMLGLYSRWIRQRDLNVSESAFQNLAGKVACKLLELLEIYGQREEAGWIISRDLPQHELAAMVGASRENVNRALQRLLGQGDVRRQGTHLIVPDPDELRRRYGWTAPPAWRLSRSLDRPRPAPVGEARSTPP